MKKNLQVCHECRDYFDFNQEGVIIQGFYLCEPCFDKENQELGIRA